jgi:hypothetical protein
MQRINTIQKNKLSLKEMTSIVGGTTETACISITDTNARCGDIETTTTYDDGSKNVRRVYLQCVDLFTPPPALMA